jgi:hypothetical protein
MTQPIPTVESMLDATGAERQDDCTIEEWIDFKNKLTDVRITKGAARYGRLRRFRDWLYHRAPWLPLWVTGWVVVRYRRPAKTFPNT